MSKKPPTPKLDSTVKRIGPEATEQDRQIPAYVKSHNQFYREVKEGDLINIKRRMHDQSKDQYYLSSLEGIVLEKAHNCIIVDIGEQDPKRIPWWAIHDWEITH